MLLQRDINTLGVSVIFIAKKNNQRKKEECNIEMLLEGKLVNFVEGTAEKTQQETKANPVKVSMKNSRKVNSKSNRNLVRRIKSSDNDFDDEGAIEGDSSNTNRACQKARTNQKTTQRVKE